MITKVFSLHLVSIGTWCYWCYAVVVVHEYDASLITCFSLSTGGLSFLIFHIVIAKSYSCHQKSQVVSVTASSSEIKRTRFSA